MKTKYIILQVCLLFLVSCGGGTDGGDVNNSSGNISGFVTDGGSGEVLSGVVVSIDERTSTTNVDGVYSIDELEVGGYVIKASKQGYAINTTNISISNEETTPHDIVLTEIVGSNVVQIVTRFENGGLDDWDVSLANKVNPINGKCGTFQGVSGYLCATPKGDGLTSYYLAPTVFFGDISEFTTLSFDIWAKGGNYYDSGYGSYGDVIIKNGDISATFIFDSNNRPSLDWSSFSISLDDNAWVLEGASTIDDVLLNVTEIHIRAEYGVGVDYSGLDNVLLSK